MFLPMTLNLQEEEVKTEKEKEKEREEENQVETDVTKKRDPHVKVEVSQNRKTVNDSAVLPDYRLSVYLVCVASPHA